MERPGGASPQPSQHLGVLMHCVVVDHCLDQLASRDMVLDGVEEADALFTPTTLHAASDHCAVEDYACCLCHAGRFRVTLDHCETAEYVRTLASSETGASMTASLVEAQASPAIGAL